MWWERSHPQYPHRLPQISTVRCYQLPRLSHTKRNFSTIFDNSRTLLAAFSHRIYILTNLAHFLDKPYGSDRRCHQCCPASTRSDSPGTVLPLSASVLWSELSGREEAVHSAGQTAAEPSVKEYKTAFPSTCHLVTVWSYKYEHRSAVNIMPSFIFFIFFFTQTHSNLYALFC